MSEMTPEQIMLALKRPFPADRLKWRKGPGGKELVYCDARMVQNRFNEVMGVDWQCRFPVVTASVAVCEIGLRIEGEWLWRSNGAGETQVEGDKGQFSDAFKRAAVMWGVGEYLYHIKGKELPKWATPEGFDELMKKRREAA